jgi:hypothetical protein
LILSIEGTVEAAAAEAAAAAGVADAAAVTRPQQVEDEEEFGLSDSEEEHGPTNVVQNDHLEDLRREVKGLSASFLKLREEHAEIQKKLRERQDAMSGSGLPVEKLMMVPISKQTPSRTGSRGPSEAAVMNKEAPLAEPAPSQRIDESSFFGGLLETCGFGSGTKKIADGASTTTSTAEPTPAQASGSSTPPHRVSQSLPVAAAVQRLHRPEVSGSLPPPPGSAMEAGGSSSSMAGSRGNATAALRAPSPHEREITMDARGNAMGSGRRPAEQSSVPSFGGGGGGGQAATRSSPRPDATSASADRQHADDGLPRFGAGESSGVEQASSFQRPAPHVTSTGAFESSAASDLRPPSMDSLGASKIPWTSPKVGEKLILPFPEADDDDTLGSSDTFSPNLGNLSSPFEKKSAVSPVPPLSGLDGIGHSFASSHGK